VSAGETAAPVRVLIADDQKIVREGLVSLLSLLPGIDVVGAATDGDDAVRQALALRPDVVLMDLNMPRCNGVEATGQLRDRQPGTRVVVLTTYADDDWVFAALQAGARGFLTKDAGAEEIHRAIATVASGDAQLDPSVQRRLLDALASGQRLAVAGQPVPPAPAPPNPATSSPTAGSAGAAAPDAHPGELTPREAEVLRHIAAGLSNTEIAAALFVTEATVKTHINHIFTKTSLRDRAQLVRYAYQHGLVRPG
jgi:DNA-binding NarL/FixJ family response regulator